MLASSAPTIQCMKQLCSKIPLMSYIMYFKQKRKKMPRVFTKGLILSLRTQDYPRTLSKPEQKNQKVRWWGCQKALKGKLQKAELRKTSLCHRIIPLIPGGFDREMSQSKTLRNKSMFMPALYLESQKSKL